VSVEDRIGQSVYSDEFGKIIDNLVLVFTWNKDDHEHGYQIRFFEENN
jgi:hypothetical protein